MDRDDGSESYRLGFQDGVASKEAEIKALNESITDLTGLAEYYKSELFELKIAFDKCG